jgi:hypothetical protein
MTRAAQKLWLAGSALAVAIGAGEKKIVDIRVAGR